MAGDLTHPYVAGIICGPKEERLGRALKKRFDAVIKRRRLPVVYLILKTKPKNFKNIKNCMKMMDVIAVNLGPNFILNKNGRFYRYLLKDIVTESLGLIARYIDTL